MAKERLLSQLVDRLRKAHGDRLVSVILYGSAAAGDHHERYSDLNVLCVLKRVSPAELADSEPVFRWWRDQNNPAPLLLSEEEVRTSTDCFPIEFHDIRERHEVLHGVDLVAGMEIDESFYRAQVEHELRAKLLRLRQKGAGVLHDRQLLVQLMADSVSTFLLLARHALLVSGGESSHVKREVLQQAAERFEVDPEPFSTLLDLREEKIKERGLDAAGLFGRYLRGVEQLVGAVDRLAR